MFSVCILHMLDVCCQKDLDSLDMEVDNAGTMAPDHTNWRTLH